MRWIISLPMLAVLGACAMDRPAERAAEADDEAVEGRALFVQPADGDTVGADVAIVLGAEGVVLEPAVGIRVAGRGHHHIFVDTDPPAAGDTIPKDVPGVVHLGTGASEFVVSGLEPGEHRLIAVLAYGDHVPMDGVRADTVRVVVRAP